MATVSGDRVKLCLSAHPLNESVMCLDIENHVGEHSFGRMAGSAIWNDGDIEWRYRPYDSEGQMLRLHLSLQDAPAVDGV